MTTDAPSPAGVRVICALAIGSPVSSATTCPLTNVGGRVEGREGDWAWVSPIALRTIAAVMRRVMAMLDDMHTGPACLDCVAYHAATRRSVGRCSSLQMQSVAVSGTSRATRPPFALLL